MVPDFLSKRLNLLEASLFRERKLIAGALHDFVIGLPLVTPNIEYRHLKSQAELSNSTRMGVLNRSKFNQE